MNSTINDSISNDNLTIGVIGLGYVGLPLAASYAEAGFEVIGVDYSQRVVDGLNSGSSHIEDVSDDRLEHFAARFTATQDYAQLVAADAVFICVPTGLADNHQPDLGPLTSASKGIGKVVRAGQTVILESTVYPGATREILLPELQKSGLQVGSEVHLAFSPERIDPGRTDISLPNIAKTLGGYSPLCADKAKEVLELVFKQVHLVPDLETAEFSKLLENTFRAVNIGLINELAIFARKIGVDIWNVVDAAATKPYGFMPFYPGPGIGGHCLPIDPFYLSWRARNEGSQLEFIELAGKVNDSMPAYCVGRIAGSLEAAGKSLKDAKIAVLGVAYKSNTADVRESPVIDLVALLKTEAGEVVFHDPHVDRLDKIDLDGVSLEQALDNADVTVLGTAHDLFDLAAITTASKHFLDLRGNSRAVTAVSESDHVERL